MLLTQKGIRSIDGLGAIGQDLVLGAFVFGRHEVFVKVGGDAIMRLETYPFECLYSPNS
jgi:hypothetical protein